VSTFVETHPGTGAETASLAIVEKAWRDELRRRIDDVRTGRVQLLTPDESRTRVRAALDESRAQ
jgi:putative addiction module component (TIGR02574 family)